MLETLASNSAQTAKFSFKEVKTGFLSIFDLEKSYSLKDFLFYDPKIKIGDRLGHGLNEYLFLVEGALRALKEFKLGNAAKFDPLVGENACQIRAVKNSILFNHDDLNDSSTIDLLKKVQSKCHRLLENLEELTKKNVSLDMLIEHKQLNITFSYTQYYLIGSYLLTCVKELRNPCDEYPFIKKEYTRFQNLKKLHPIGTIFAETLIDKLREITSYQTTLFVKECADSHIDYEFADLLATSEEYMTHYKHLYALPCFWSTKIVLAKAKEQKIPIIVIGSQLVKSADHQELPKKAVIFTVGSDGEYHLSSFKEVIDPHQYAIFLMGCSYRERENLVKMADWKKELATINPLDFVLSYAAAHRQYPKDCDSNILGTLLKNKMFNYYYQKALSEGFCLENPSKLFLRHAFCDKIANYRTHLHD